MRWVLASQIDFRGRSDLPGFLEKMILPADCSQSMIRLALDHQNRFFVSYSEQTWLIVSEERAAAV